MEKDKMPKLTESDLIYKDDYVNTAKDASDDPKVIFSDNKRLSRSEKYEVLHFLNALTASGGKDLPKKTRRICEWMLKNHVPTNIESTTKIRTWIVDNYKDYAEKYPFKD
ncbi:MAG: hypothetical protein E6Y29_17275 [Klebsiella pneumoniae]|uniref:hypothetical protein n=1 Tax=Klebsiella pneumoniae TaxID=573 RepID=UPI001D0E78FD|nr:hypothetical protein [Klebsiella pneumoniae]MDU4609075.1 hypothetical protein [Klebsiella pneumoniae]